MMYVNYLNFIFVFCLVFEINGEWIEIAQNAEHKSAMERSIHSLHSTKNLDDLKYEDLADLIGPNFEEEFEKYLNEHRNKIGKKTYLNESMFVSDNNESTTASAQVSKVNDKHIFYADPWAIYDQPAKTTISKKLLIKFNETNTWPVLNGDKNTNVYISSSIPLSIVNDSTEKSAEQVSQSLTSATTTTTSTEAITQTNSTYLIDNVPKSIKRKLIFKRVEFKPFNFSGIFNFLKNIQKNFSFGTSQNVHEKVKYLEKFKDQMMSNIEERLNMLWPSKLDSSKRTKRGLWDSAGHGTDFPSSETALMTISLLTFAVFLIKLVLQVIHTIKSKHYNFNALQPMTSQPADAPIKFIKKGRNARKLSISDMDLSMIMTTVSSPEKFQTN